mmetsp:Transcript_93374/g.302237  ORF Transcript_93374/g.302237 Transcript_93374/m.302237 type:complete len:238 (+) Transcript_93374:500-1213(+)
MMVLGVLVDVHGPCIHFPRGIKVSSQPLERALMREYLGHGNMSFPKQLNIFLQGPLQMNLCRIQFHGWELAQSQRHASPSDLVWVLKVFGVVVDCQSRMILLLRRLPLALVAMHVSEANQGNGKLRMVRVLCPVQFDHVLEFLSRGCELALMTEIDRQVHPGIQNIQMLRVAMLNLHRQDLAVDLLRLDDAMRPAQGVGQVVKCEGGAHVVGAKQVDPELVGGTKLDLGLSMPPLVV